MSGGLGGGLGWAKWLIPGGAADELFLAPGRRAAREQKRSLQDQSRLQQQALQDQQRERQRADMALAAANRKKPDVGSLLAQEQQDARGRSMTTLTSPLGIDPAQLKLGHKSLLGM